MGRTRTFAVSTALLLWAAGCGDSTGLGASDLAGTWRLVSIDGVPAPAGTLTWTLSSNTFVANSDNGDCIERGSYTLSGNRMTAVVTNISGPGCGGEIGDTVVFTVSVAGDALTVLVTDPEIEAVSQKIVAAVAKATGAVLRG